MSCVLPHQPHSIAYMRTNGKFIYTFDYHSHILPFAITPFDRLWKCPIHANEILFTVEFQNNAIDEHKMLIWPSIDYVIHLLSVCLLTSSQTGYPKNWWWKKPKRMNMRGVHRSFFFVISRFVFGTYSGISVSSVPLNFAVSLVYFSLVQLARFYQSCIIAALMTKLHVFF